MQDAGSLAAPGRRDRGEGCHQKPEGEGLQAVRAAPQRGAWDVDICLHRWVPAARPLAHITSRDVPWKPGSEVGCGCGPRAPPAGAGTRRSCETHLVRTLCWGHTELGSQLNCVSLFLCRATVHTNLERFEPLQHPSAQCRGNPWNLVSWLGRLRGQMCYESLYQPDIS